MNTFPKVTYTDTLFYADDTRVQELNQRLWSRNQPDRPPPVNFDIRPTPTKYSVFPILDQRMPVGVPILPNSNTGSFLPTMTTGPVQGFIQNVDKESDLRNQYFALQRGNDQACYVPSSNSDMYRVTLAQSTTRNEVQDFPLLFEKSSFSKAIHPNLYNNTTVGVDRLNNHTRTQNR
jgi:hypothetical protein